MGIEPVTTRCLVVVLTTKLLAAEPKHAEPPALSRHGGASIARKFSAGGVAAAELAARRRAVLPHMVL